MSKKIFTVCGAVLLGLFLVASAFAGDSGKIVYIKGTVSVSFDGQNWVPAQTQMGLNEGDLIKTFEDSYCDIALDKKLKNIVSIGPNTEISLGDQLKKINVGRGRIFSVLEGLEPGTTFEVQTPQAIAGVRGTRWETVVNDTTTFNVTEHTISVTGVDEKGEKTGEQDVPEGNSITVDENGWLGDLAKLSDEDKARLDDWARRIESTLKMLQSKYNCSDLIQKYAGRTANLFEDVLDCESKEGNSAFASTPDGTPPLLKEGGSDLGITGSDITKTSPFQGPSGGNEDVGAGQGGDETGGGDNGGGGNLTGGGDGLPPPSPSGV